MQNSRADHIRRCSCQGGRSCATMNTYSIRLFWNRGTAIWIGERGRVLMPREGPKRLASIVPCRFGRSAGSRPAGYTAFQSFSGFQTFPSHRGGNRRTPVPGITVSSVSKSIISHGRAPHRWQSKHTLPNSPTLSRNAAGCKKTNPARATEKNVFHNRPLARAREWERGRRKRHVWACPGDSLSLAIAPG